MWGGQESCQSQREPAHHQASHVTQARESGYPTGNISDWPRGKQVAHVAPVILLKFLWKLERSLLEITNSREDVSPGSARNFLCHWGKGDLILRISLTIWVLWCLTLWVLKVGPPKQQQQPHGLAGNANSHPQLPDSLHYKLWKMELTQWDLFPSSLDGPDA